MGREIYLEEKDREKHKIYIHILLLPTKQSRFLTILV